MPDGPRTAPAKTRVNSPAPKPSVLGRGCYWVTFGLSFASRVVGGVLAGTAPASPVLPQEPSAAPNKKAPVGLGNPGSNARMVRQEVGAEEGLRQVAPVGDPSASPCLVPTRTHRPGIFARMVAVLFAGLRRMRDNLRALSGRRGAIWEYGLVTLAYWGLTITDGAIRMLVLFQFYQMGYTAFQIASLFILYEIFGVLTNLFGGWIAAKRGVRFTLFGGMAAQIVSLLMLALISPTWPAGLLVAYTMVSQALSGIAKDLTKMSSKSAVKALIAKDNDKELFRWVSFLTGSKNALKGVGFFVGALLLTVTGFKLSLLLMGGGLMVLYVALDRALPKELGSKQAKAKFKSMFSMDRRVNLLSAARFFLFGARDVWFVIALPVYMAATFGWSPLVVGAYLAFWTIGYGIVQSIAPRFFANREGKTPGGYTVMFWAAVLTAVPIGIALALGVGLFPGPVIVLGLGAFGVIFAINSAVHSYMIVHYAESEKIAMTIGFYYMANAGGRLIGTIISGWAYQTMGIVGCLWISGAFVGAAALISSGLILPPARQSRPDRQLASPGPANLVIDVPTIVTA